MPKRLALNSLIVAAIFLGPLAARPALLASPAPWLAATIAAAVLLSQPRIDMREAFSRSAADGGSAIGIFAAMTSAQLAAAIEFSRSLATPTGSAFVVGAAVALAGLGLRLWAIRTLGRFFTSTVRVVDGQRIVRSGPYRWLRHPSYTGALLAAFGTAVALESRIGVLLVLGICIPAYLYRIAIEERTLIVGLGPVYAEYRKRTWSLIPGVR
jgi:protein-S-isoprenylcysteine O-methyltransferase